MRQLVSLCALAAALSSPLTANAQAPDPALAPVQAIDAAFMASMHHDTMALATAVDADFNVEIMASFIVGPGWAQMSAADQGAISSALRRYLVARFADEFDSYNGEQFQVDPTVQSRGLDRLVHTQVVASSESPSRLDYRLRAYDGRWRVIDVYLDGVSQLTTQRADLASVLQSGAAALAARIDQATRALQ